MLHYLPDPIYNLIRRYFGSYRLDDPRPIQKEAPYTYHLPSQAPLDSLQIGDRAKLLFRSVPAGVKYGVERMWVEVTAIEGDKIFGKLLNKPFDTPQLKEGAHIHFQRFHIIDIGTERQLPDEIAHKQYWERCMVDQCVLDGVPVYYIYREVPDMDQENDEYPDSGWCIRGDYRDVTDEELDARKARYIALGKVLNVDDSWIHLIDSPIGSAYLRNFETGVYDTYDRATSDDN